MFLFKRLPDLLILYNDKIYITVCFYLNTVYIGDIVTIIQFTLQYVAI